MPDLAVLIDTLDLRLKFEIVSILRLASGLIFKLYQLINGDFPVQIKSFVLISHISQFMLKLFGDQITIHIYSWLNDTHL